MIILDTKALSALTRAEPEMAVVRWLDRQPVSSIWTTSITPMEIRYGLQSMPPGRRREQMTQEVEAVLREEIEGRYASFDIAAAEQAAELMALRRSQGRPVELRDNIFAAMGLAFHVNMATHITPVYKDHMSMVLYDSKT